jgi:hypothetical protein
MMQSGSDFEKVSLSQRFLHETEISSDVVGIEKEGQPPGAKP